MLSVNLYVSADTLTVYVVMADVLHGLTLSLHVSGIPRTIYGLTLQFLRPTSAF